MILLIKCLNANFKTLCSFGSTPIDDPLRRILITIIIVIVIIVGIVGIGTLIHCCVTEWKRYRDRKQFESPKTRESTTSSIKTVDPISGKTIGKYFTIFG